MKIDDGVGCHQAKVSEKMEASFEGRQTKGIEKMNEGVEGCQATRREKMESKAVRQKGDRDKVGWLRGVTGTMIRRFQVRILACSPIKHICLFYEETPQPRSDPPIVRMARWPKTPGE